MKIENFLINPLFAIEAEKLVQSGDYDRAIGLCKNGIETYPGYATAWIMLADAYEKNNQLDFALNIIDEAQKHFPIHPGLNNFLGSLDISNTAKDDYNGNGIEFISQFDLNLNDTVEVIETGDETQTIIETKESFVAPAGFLLKFKSEKTDFVQIDADGILPSIENYKYIKTQLLAKERSSYDPSIYMSGMQSGNTEDKINDDIVEQTDESSNMSFENNLKKLAKKLEEVSLSQTNPLEVKTESPESHSHGIITETMANIYIAQGAYEEALAAYKHLLLLNPDKENYYKEKISDINAKIK